MESILDTEDFQKLYGEEILENLIQDICEAFYSEDYNDTALVSFMYTNKENEVSPQNPQSNFSADFIFDNKAFHIDISDGISNGTEILDFYLDEEETKGLVLEKVTEKINNFN